MPAALLMVLSTALFALMGVAVKSASAHYGTGEIVVVRSLIGTLLAAGLAWHQGVALSTQVPGRHLWRGLVGTSSMLLWFAAMSRLPLATAVTLNYMSSVWMACFLLLRTWRGHGPIDVRLVTTVALGFVGVALVLQPTLSQNQLGFGLLGLASGMFSAAAYLLVAALGRAGEPEQRVVFYFSLVGVAVGLAAVPLTGGFHPHGSEGLWPLVAAGVLATIAQLAMTRAYAIGRPLVNASLQYLGIVFSFGLGVWWFDDPVTAPALFGMALIIAAGLRATQVRAHGAPDAGAPPASDEPPPRP